MDFKANSRNAVRAQLAVAASITAIILMMALPYFGVSTEEGIANAYG